MIAEFNKNWEEDYEIKSAAVLQSVIDKRDTAHRKNAKTVCDRNTALLRDTAAVWGSYRVTCGVALWTRP